MRYLPRSKCHYLTFIYHYLQCVLCLYEGKVERSIERSMMCVVCKMNMELNSYDEYMRLIQLRVVKQVKYHQRKCRTMMWLESEF